MSNRYLTLIADTHLAQNPHYDISVAVRAFKTAIDCAAESEEKLLIHGGDFFNAPVLGVIELDAAAEIISYACKKDIKLLINTGNHDIDTKNRSVIAHLNSYNQTAKLMQNVEVAGRDILTYWTTSGKPRGHIQIVLMPFGKAPQDAIDIAKERGYRKAILVAHTDLNGAQYDSGHQSVSGWNTETLETLLEHYERVVLGHVHMPQEFLGGRVFYIGANLQYNFGSIGQDRGFLTMDLEDFEVTRYVTVGDGWPEFLDIDYKDIDECSTDIKNRCYRISAGDSPVSDGDIEKEAKELGIQSVKVKRDIARVETVVKRSTIEIDDDPYAMGEKYLQTLDIDEEERDELIKINKEILRGIGL